MATKHITVTELKFACLDTEWRRKWMNGKKPSTRTYTPPGAVPVYGSIFHQIVDAFIERLVSSKSKKIASLKKRETLWTEMYNRYGASKLDNLLKGKQVESGYHLIQALKAFCGRLAELRERTVNFSSWNDVFLANEFNIKDVAFELGESHLFVSGRIDAIRHHPEHGTEIVDYKLNHGDKGKHDLLQLAIYGKLVSISKPGITFQGLLEYYEPELESLKVDPKDLDNLFNEVVLPILYELVEEEIPDKKKTVIHEETTAETEEEKKPVDDLSSIIQKCYASFKLNIDVLDRSEAPQLVRYKVKPAPGVKVVSLANRADDLKVALSLSQSPMIEPAKGCVVIDIPKEKPDTVYWKDVIDDPSLKDFESRAAFPVGIGIDNRLIIADFANSNTCHALVAGAAGAGKSEFLKNLVAALINRNGGETIKLSIIDPKILTFGGLKNIPHFVEPVITDIKQAIPCLQNAVQEMNDRYQQLADEGYENLSARFKDDKTNLPFYVIVFDEFMDLILSDKKDKKEFEKLVAKLAAKGRAAGVHLVLATQRPDSTVVTGLIKANLPLKICMRVTNSANSSIVLDQTGAEKLLGRGDLLCDRGYGVERAQSPYITQKEMQALS